MTAEQDELCHWATDSREAGGVAGGSAWRQRGLRGGDAHTGWWHGPARAVRVAGRPALPQRSQSADTGTPGWAARSPVNARGAEGSSTWWGRSSLVAGMGLAKLVRDLMDGGQWDGVTSLQRRPRGHHTAPTVCWEGTGMRPGLRPTAAHTTHLPPQATVLSPAPAWLVTCAHLCPPATGPARPCHQGLLAASRVL